MISPLPCFNNHAVVLAGADISPDSDLDGDTQILATLLKSSRSFISYDSAAYDILYDILYDIIYLI